MESPSFTFGDSAADELVETIMAATAQFGRTGNREQVLHRMQARLEAGYWTFPAPPGYRFVRHPVHKKLMVIDPVAKALLASALDGFASGRLVTQRQVALVLDEGGFFGTSSSSHAPFGSCTQVTVLEKRVSRLFDRLPLYAGLLEYPAWGIERRPAQHEAVIHPATLARIEERLAHKEAAPLSLGALGVGRSNANPALPLRNFLRCSGCARPLTGCLAKGKYPRYHCYFQACSLYGRSYSARRMVEPAFVELLRGLTPSDAFIELVETVTPPLWKLLNKESGARSAHIERELAVVRGQIAGLVRRLSQVSDEIAAEVEREIIGLKRQAVLLEGRLHDGGRVEDYEAAWRRVHTYFTDPAGIWERGSENQKRTVHRLVFTVPPQFERKSGLHTYELSLPYRVSRSFVGSKGQMVDLTDKTSHQIFTQSFFDQIIAWAKWLA